MLLPDKLKSTAIVILLMFSAVTMAYALLKPPTVQIKEVPVETPPEIVERVVPKYIKVPAEKIRILPKAEIEEAFSENPEETPALPEAEVEKVLAVKEFSVPTPAKIVVTSTLNTETGEADILAKQFPLEMSESNLVENARSNLKDGALGEWAFFDSTELYLDYSTQGTAYGLRQNIAKAGWLKADAYLEGGQYSFYDEETGHQEQRGDVILGVQVSVRVDQIAKVFKK